MTTAFTISAANTNPPKGKNILVTGGSSGIGLATSTLLLEARNNVVSLDRSPPPADAPSSLKHITCDITSWLSQRQSFETALAHFSAPGNFSAPRLDAVFVNAGIGEYGSQFFEEPLDASGKLEEPDRRTLDLDVAAVVDTLKLAIYYMRTDKRGQRGGSIVMTASLAGYLASAGAALYSAAKHGVVGYLRAMKGDCAKVGISLSVVAPGIALTSIIGGMKMGGGLEEWGEEMRKRGVAINSAEEVGRVVCWLMGQGKEASGKGILVQGGRCADLEAGLAKSREIWMGKEMLDLFRGGRTAPLFPAKLS